MKTLNFVASQSILKIHVFFPKILSPPSGVVKIVAKLLVSDDSYFDFFLKKRRFQKHSKILLRNEAQTVRLCGFDVMKIIENRRHPRDFEDLKQLFNSRDQGGDTTPREVKGRPKVAHDVADRDGHPLRSKRRRPELGPRQRRSGRAGRACRPRTGPRAAGRPSRSSP